MGNLQNWILPGRYFVNHLQFILIRREHWKKLSLLRRRNSSQVPSPLPILSSMKSSLYVYRFPSFNSLCRVYSAETDSSTGPVFGAPAAALAAQLVFVLAGNPTSIAKIKPYTKRHGSCHHPARRRRRHCNPPQNQWKHHDPRHCRNRR